MGRMDDEFYSGINDADVSLTNKEPAERNGRIIVRNIFGGRPISVDWAVAKNKYMQHVVNQQLEMEESIKKEESDSDDDDKPPLNVTSDDVKDEVKSESDSDADSDEEDSSSESDDEDAKKGEVKNESDENDEEDSDQEDDDDDDDDEPEADVKPDFQRVKLNDAEDGCTVFIRNIPFSVDNGQLREFAERVGPVKYALVCVDHLTEHSKGSGFVKFVDKEHADMFLSLPADQLKLEGQTLQVQLALKRENLQKGNTKAAKDNRNLYVVKEGVVVAGTQAAVGVSASDMAKRHALERSKTQMLKNLNRFVSRYRLVVSNLPAHFDDAKLRRVCVTAADKRATVTECRVMRDLRTPSGADGKHPTHMRVFHNVATKHYIRATEVFHETPCRAPGLFLVSKTDLVGAEKRSRSVHDSWVRSGMKCNFKCWDKSPHVLHYIKHPEEYKQVLYSHLDECGLLKKL